MELICFQLITAAGAAKSNYIGAIQKAREGLYEDADKLIKEAQGYFAEGHHAHAELIQQEASGEKVEFALLLMHAEDQLMNAEVFGILAEEFISVYKLLHKS